MRKLALYISASRKISDAKPPLPSPPTNSLIGHTNTCTLSHTEMWPCMSTHLFCFLWGMNDELQKLLLLPSSTTPLAGDRGWTSEEWLSHHVPITRLVDEHNWLGRRGWTSFPFCRVENTNCPCQVIMSALFNGTIKNFIFNLVSWRERCVLIAQSGCTAEVARKHIGWMVCLHLLEKKKKKMKAKSHFFLGGTIGAWLWHWLKEKKWLFKLREAEKADGPERITSWISIIVSCLKYDQNIWHSLKMERWLC